MSLPYSLKYSLGPLILAFITTLAFFFEPASGQYFAYDRYAIQGLETWRLLTGNLALHGEHYRAGLYLKVFAWCGLGTSAGLYFYAPDLIWYAGLSGALHGIFAWGACMDILNRMKSGWVLLAGVAVKVIYEQTVGGSADVAALIDAKVAIDAHLFGAMSGVLLFFLMWLTKLPFRKTAK